MQILLVEDNPIDQMFVAQSLRQIEHFEYSLALCTTLTQALERLCASPCDVIMLDLWLPDSEGLDTCHRILAAGHDIPVVVMTGADGYGLATEAIRSGAQDYLVKGDYSGSAIARVLQYAIDRHQFFRKVAQRENEFGQVLSHVPAIIWTTDAQLTVNTIAGAGLQVLKIDPKQVVGQTLEEYFKRTGNSDDFLTAHRAALGGKSSSIQTSWQGRNFEARVDPYYDPKSNVAGTIGVAMDVTDRTSVDREINCARLVQEALLPAKHPRLSGFDIYGASYPARRTCGDWFDYLTFPDGSIGLAVGDVSGKGFGPAILSATIAAFLEVLAESHAEIQEILTCCNNLVCKRNLDGQFAVLALARLHSGSCSVAYGGAGEHLLIVSGHGQSHYRIATSGVPLGCSTDLQYDPAAQVPLQPGDILLLLTDGFRESHNSNRELFGEDRIIEVATANLHASACEIFHSIRNAIQKFSGDTQQYDDMTGIVVKVLNYKDQAL